MFDQRDVISAARFPASLGCDRIMIVLTKTPLVIHLLGIGIFIWVHWNLPVHLLLI